MRAPPRLRRGGGAGGFTPLRGTPAWLCYVLQATKTPLVAELMNI